MNISESIYDINSLNETEFKKRFTDDFMVFTSDNGKLRLTCYYSEYLQSFTILFMGNYYYRIAYANFKTKVKSLTELHNLK